MNASTDAGTDPSARQGPLPTSSLLYAPLMRWNRWLVAGLLGLALAGGLVVLGALYPYPLPGTIRGDPLDNLFQALIVATVTSATLVVSLNQLALKEELAPVAKEQKRFQGAVGFRESVGSHLEDRVAPPDPPAFLRAHLGAIADAAERLRDAAPEEEVDEYVESLRMNALAVARSAEGARFGTFDVVFAAMGFDHSLKSVEAGALRERYGDTWGLEAHRALDDLVELLSHFGPTREYLKTRYVQWDLINLSRGVLATALPALMVSVAGLVYLDPRLLAGEALGVSHLVWVASFATVVAVFPFLLFLAHILRIATLAQHTLTVGPFVLRLGNRQRSVGWEKEEGEG